MQTNEIITFQIGHYSNFVGTHWWNIQESSFCYDASQADSLPINHDVLFREGSNLKGEPTYSPRLISIDLKGSLKTLKEEDSNVSKSSSSIKWPGEFTIQSSLTQTKNEFLQDLDRREEIGNSISQEDRVFASGDEISDDILASFLPKKYDLDEQVEVWSDFLGTRLHPKSVMLLEEYHHNYDSELFDVFGCGVQASQLEHNHEAIQDKIRNFSEECDYLQGFQILLDGYNGFAGVASTVLLHLDEEYGQKARICYPLFKPIYKSHRPGEAHSEEVHRLLTSLLCLNDLVSNSSIFSPLGLGSDGFFQSQQDPVPFNHVSYKPELEYHTSCILAVALQTLTLPIRLKNLPTRLRDQVQQMTYGNRKLVSSSMCLPLPLEFGQSLSEFFSQSDAMVLSPLTPLTHSKNVLIQSLVFSGIPQQTVSNPAPGSSQKTIEEVLAKHVISLYPSAALFLKNIDPPCKVTAPFPNIFSPSVGTEGFLRSTERHHLLGVQSVSVAVAYRNSSSCAQPVHQLLSSAAKVNFRKFHHCLEMGIEMDDIKEAINNLEAFADNYGESGFLIEG